MNCPSCGAAVPGGFKFCGQCGASLEAAPPRFQDQRREVAVLFADISGFTAMSEKLDPEEVHQLMNRCFEGIGRVIEQEGGYIDKYIGDNVMALFGAPVAHEDDPGRACRAALGIQQFLGDFSEETAGETGLRLRARIGINHGLVVAGGVGAESRRDYTVMGDTVNLASRLESAAQPGSSLVSGEIRERVGDEFEFAPPVEFTLKGKSQPVPAYELLGENQGSRSAQVVPDDMPVIGRDGEIDALRRFVEEGRRWIEIHGEIGVGKTRLAHAALRGLSGREVLEIQCTHATSRRPLGLVRRLTQELFDRFTEVSTESFPAFREMLSLFDNALPAYANALWFLATAEQPSDEVAQENPEAFRRTTERGFACLLEVCAARNPGLLFLLDAYDHADEPSARLIEALSRASEMPAAILTRRSPADDDELIRTQLQLDPLDASAAQELLAALLAGRQVSEALRRDILRRASGVPLFLEEIFRGLLESGELDSEDGARGVATSVELPSSLRAAMVGRIDRLPPASRELLRLCAVQGTEFEIPVLERVAGAAGMEAGRFERSLESLGARGILELPRASNAAARFIAPLLQEACYQTILRRDRKRLHTFTARALCEHGGGEERVEPELLAHHCELAEDWLGAAAAKLRAAGNTANLFLNDAALEGFAAVAALLERVDKPGRRARRIRVLALCREIDVRLRTGHYDCAGACVDAIEKIAVTDDERTECARLRAEIHARTGHAEEAIHLYSRVVSTDFTGDYPEPQMTSLAWYGLAELQHRSGKMNDALYSVRCCRATATAGSDRIRLRADLLEGLIAHTRGEFSEARRLYERAFERAEKLGLLAERARALNNLGNVARDEGNYDAAADSYRESLELWSRIADPECIAGAHNNLGNLEMSRGCFDEAREQYKVALAANLGTGNVNGAALAHANLGILGLEEEDGAAAVAAAHSALSVLAGAENHVLRGLVEVILGDGHVLLGEVEKAEAIFQQILAEFTPSNHPLAVAGAERGLGRAALLKGEWEIAEKRFARAASDFQRLQRSHEEARTTLDRARAAVGRGDPDRARQLAREALGRFEGLAATRDITRAKKLLH